MYRVNKSNKYIFFLYIILSIKTYGINGKKCFDYTNWNFHYHIFNAPILKESKKFLTEVNGDTEKDLINYGKKLNDLIINNNSNNFSKQISKIEFNIYLPGETIRNEGEKIRNQLINQKGEYFEMIFNTSTDDLDDQAKYYGEDIDLRQYLICFNKNLKWRVFFNSKLNLYLVKFSIPDEFINRFGFFVYCVRKEKNKLSLVGF